MTDQSVTAGGGAIVDEKPRRGIRLGRIFLTRNQAIAVAAALIIVVAGATAVAMRLSAANQGGDVGPSGAAVTVAAVARRDLALSTAITGVLAPQTSLDLNCKVAGVVSQVHVALGDAVSKGQALVTLSSSDLAPQVQATAAVLDAARASLLRVQQGATWEELEQVRSTLTQAQAAWDAAVQAYARMRYLYDEGAISRQQFEAAETQVKVSTAQLTAAQMQMSKIEGGADQASLLGAEAQVKQAQAAYDAARARLEDTIMRAPSAGVVSYVSISAGELVSPGMPQVGIVATGRVYLEAAITENLLPSLVQGTQLAVYIPAYQMTRTATIDEIAPAANPQTRLFQVRIGLDNADGVLRGGLTAEARIETSRATAVLVVPRASVVTSGKVHSVFVVTEAVARRRVVELGLLTDELAEVLSGVVEGERVVVAGVDFLRDGSTVNVVREVTP